MVPYTGPNYRQNNVKQIALALTYYEWEHRSFPPAATAEKDGQPAMSWRVAILPHLEENQLFQKYDRKQPWNSPRNRAVADTPLLSYRCPNDPKGPRSRETSYVMLVGKGTVAGLPEKDRNFKYISAHSGASSTILFVEAPNSGIPWAEPRDLTIDEFIKRLKSHKGGFPGGCICLALCDGSVRLIRTDISPYVFRALANPSRDGPIDESEWY